MTKLRRSLSLFVLLALASANSAVAQLASFSFGGPSTVSGWTNLPGDPYSAVQTATASGITISSISTGNWAPNGVPSSEYNAGGASAGVYFPAGVMANGWLQYNGSSYNLALYNAAVPQLLLSGLNADSTYILRMTGSDQYYTGNTQYTVAGASVAGSQQLNTYNNTTQGVTFTHVQPDASGTSRIYVNATGNSLYGFISGVQVYSGSANIPVPVIALTAPTNGVVQSEGSNFIISAAASETGGTIAKVEFYADTTKIGEADAAPYTMTWVNPGPGSYQITVKATDGVGTISSASMNVGVRLLNYFWSTTGNIATGGDTSFLGTVDSNRLAFWTKNIERMTISAIGNVGIGTDSPTAQLHTTGSVRLAGMGNDSSNVQPRMLVSDSSGRLYYRNISTGGLGAGQGLGQTAGGIALGDSVAGTGPHGFGSNRYQYLNGHQYSFGGSVNDPVNRPVFRMYDNGDFTAGTTMDYSIKTAPLQPGLLHYGKMDYLQIGPSKLIDTTKSVLTRFGTHTSGLLLSIFGSTMKGQISNSVYSNDNDGERGLVDSGFVIDGSYFNGTGFWLSGDTNYIRYSLVQGGNGASSGQYSGPITYSLIIGGIDFIAEPTTMDIIIGGTQQTMDTSSYSLAVGEVGQFGGTGQVTVGAWLVNRTPFGTVLGNRNVDFSTLSYTGTRGAAAPRLAGYPILAIGNMAGGAHSNAVTTLFNGRTQINTTGVTNNLTQAQVTPQAALDVVSTNTGVLLPRLTTAQRNAIASTDLQNGLLLYNTDSALFQFYSGGAWASAVSGSIASGRWLASGATGYDSLDKIGIGTSNTQGYMLAVNGSAIFTKIKVTSAANWPDYVFKRDYRLPGLPELEQYIASHRHLPELASAETVSKEGQDMGENQAALLKKVEELTLYVIELDKEVKTLTEQNEQLKKRKLAASAAVKHRN
ncbi:MAG TPA: Ig-like domain-containing protein [Puia sp.]|nr:Ig-like domain-containing protein [Puia sp.]